MSLAIRALSLALLTGALGCSRETPADDFPGLALLARVEKRLARERETLAPQLDHYRLVFPVEPSELAAYMQAVRVHGHGADLALGDEHALKAHGGGVLRLLFELWRPGGRSPTLDDRFPFEAGRRPLALGQLVEADRQQLFLPRGDFPQLPRMRVRFRSPGEPVRVVEADAYHFLMLLIALEPDPEPGAWLLLAAGGAALAWRVQRASPASSVGPSGASPCGDASAVTKLRRMGESSRGSRV